MDELYRFQRIELYFSQLNELVKSWKETAQERYSIPNWLHRKAYISECSSICMLVGLPKPWPAFVWMRINGAFSALTGLQARCKLERMAWYHAVIMICGGHQCRTGGISPA